MRHKNNDSTTPSKFIIGELPPRSTWHKNNDSTTPSRFIIGELPPRSTWHKNNDSTTPSRFTIGALPSRSMRHKNNDSTTRRPHRGSQSARCRHDRRGTKTTTRRPHRGSKSARCRHGAHSNLCRHGRCDTKQRLDDPIEVQNRLSVVTADPAQKRTTRRPHRRSRPAIFAIMVDAAQQRQKRLDVPIAVHNRRATVTVHPAQKELPDGPIDVHNRLFVPSRSIQHKNNYSTTHSRVTNSYSCHHSRCGTKTTTRRPHRGSQSAICVITLDPAQNNDSTTPSRFTIGALPSRSMRHKNNDSTTRRPHRGSQSARCRHDRRGTKTTTRRPHRGSKSARCRHGAHSNLCRHGRCDTKQRLDDPIEVQNRLSAVTADPAQKKNDPTTPSTFTTGYFCHHGGCGTTTTKTTGCPHRGSQSARYRHGSSGTKRTTRWPHRRSQSAICAITVDPTQKQLLDDPFKGHKQLFVPSQSMRHKNNDSTTPSRFTIGHLCHNGRSGTKQRLDDPIEVHNRRAAATVDVAQKQRLDDPISVHNRRAAITVDAAQKQRLDDPTTPSRFTIRALSSRSTRHKNNDSTIPTRFTIGALPPRCPVESLSSRSIRHKTTTE